nr:MAG TPA: hypothetical protein [Caudoviricetes sp.]
MLIWPPEGTVMGGGTACQGPRLFNRHRACRTSSRFEVDFATKGKSTRK